jgi:anaerobic selenocysteine-containing dehydrogenase
MMELRRAGEPEKFMVMRGRYTYMNDTIYSALPKIFGSPNGISHSSICAESEKFGAYFTHGLWDYRDYDLDNAKYVLIWGADPISSNRMIPATIRRFGEVLDKATVAVVDPKLLVEGLWHKEFVGDFKDGKNLFKKGITVTEDSFEERHTHGLVKWWNIELKDKDPAWAAKTTGLDAEQIIRVAKGLGKAAPNVCVWAGPGASMHVRGGYSAMAVEALNGILGSIDNEGGVMAATKIPVNKIPEFDKYQDEISKKHSKMQKIDQRGYKEYPALKEGKSGGGVVTNNVATAMLARDPYEIKVAIGYMNNFVFSCTGAQRWEEALTKLPFLAHVTTHASEMTQYADIVLPAAITKYEKLGYVKTKANGYATCTLVQPVVKPIWDVRVDETEFIWDLAAKLKEKGFANLHDYLRQEFKDPETGKEPTDGVEFTEYNLKIQTAPLWDGKKDVGGDKIHGWAEFRKLGMWNSAKYEYKERWGHFKTKTGKFEFYSETLKEALEKHAEKHATDVDDIMKATNYTARGELCFVPHYEPPVRIGNEKEFPFQFIDYKSRLNREGRSQNATWFQDFKHVDIGDVGWDDVLKINPKDAANIGVRDGDMVKVSSVNGSFTVKVKLWEGIRPGTVSKCYGQGHWAYGRVASRDYSKAIPRGLNNNEIMPFETERLSGSNVRNGGFTGVKVEKA